MREKKLRLLLGFYKYDLIILGVFIISVFLLIKSTDYGYFLDWEFIEVFDRFEYGNDLVFNLSIGFIVSSIFYFINIFLPKVNNLKKYYEIIKWNIEVIFKSVAKIYIMILDEKDSRKILDCSEDRLKDCISTVDPTIRYQYEGMENNINKEIYRCYDLVLKHSEYLINFHSIIPVELLRILIKLKEPILMLNLSMIEHANKDNFSNFQGDFIKLHNHFKEIALYKEVFIDRNLR